MNKTTRRGAARPIKLATAGLAGVGVHEGAVGLIVRRNRT